MADYLSSSIAEFSQPSLVQEWRSAYETGQLKLRLMSHFKLFVPKVFICATQVDTEKEDRKARKFLFAPLEAFICNGDPETVFGQLKEQDKPPQLCGNVFKVGEPTYSCRDCGMDQTCVLCIKCFQQSVHKEHKYRMSTSGGGGYCDCGDTEAWKSEPFCNIHKKGLETEPDHDPISLLPEDLRNRVAEVFDILMEYVLLNLTYDNPTVLPDELAQSEVDDTHVTMLFNDEVNTYEQVITTLLRAIHCTQKEAVDFATTVDREGRSVVRVGKADWCEKAKTVVENPSHHVNKPLRVVVMHTSVIAHQIFSVKILAWLQDIISKSDGLRNLYCKIAMAVKDDRPSQMERALLADTKFWKVAKIQSHQLMMAGVLMDQEYKKKFAVLFTKLFTKLNKDFILDDHDHSVSVVSESVQLFTVPTLARLLITDHDLLSVILRTFLDECKTKKKRDGRFAFVRNELNHQFKRAQFMLFDLKYALSYPPSPEEWNDSLRNNFLNGFAALLDLLKCMQGMDSVTRQVGQHVEFEPEWEVAFNLQVKLSDNLALFLQWCGSDRDVLIKAYRTTVGYLYSCPESDETTYVKSPIVSGKEANCIKYDVSTQPVSIHLPVTRLLAGLHLHLEKHNLTFFSPEIADYCKLGPIELMELSLRTQVMIGQTQAGMWRRNGYSLLNQIYFYSNVRCRSEMFDRDIIMLQAGGSLIESNEFIIHLLNKYGLLSWIKDNYDLPGGAPPEEMIRQVIVIAEEFLNLLIILLGERYVPGVGQVKPEESLHREVIHQLCISSMAHSELSKALPEDSNEETGIDKVLNQVAEFRKPAGTGKGIFELKPQYYADYNPYFYHYTRADQTKSEEAQRKRKKLASEDQALPPPKPPPFTQNFAPLVNLLHCDVMIHMIKLVLTRTQATRSRSWSEAQFEKILHIIGLALHEDQRSYDSGEGAFCFFEKSTQGEDNILSILKSLPQHPNLTHDAQKDLLTWILKKFADVGKLKDSTVCMETVSSSSQNKNEKLEREKRKKAEMAAKRRNKIMAQMSTMQKNFIKENAELFESTSTELQPAGSDMDVSVPVPQAPVAVGSNRTSPTVTCVTRATCILCQEQQDITHNGRAMVLASFVQRSTVLARKRGRVIEDPEQYDPLFMPADLFCGTHSSTCGHTMHADCWQRFFDSVLMQERRRMFRYRHHPSFDIEKMEFLCPLCETISNSVIPLVPPLHTLVKDGEEKKTIDLSLNDWLDGLLKTVEASVQEAIKKAIQEEDAFMLEPCPLPLITRMMADSVARNFQMLYYYVYDTDSVNFSDSIKEMIRKYSRDVYSVGLGVHPDDDNWRVPILAWSTCAYTLQTVERCLQSENKPLFGSMTARQSDCLSSLVRFGAVCSQVQPKDLIKKQCIRLLTALFHKSETRPKTPAPCLLDIDMFHYFIKVVLSLPTLYTEDQRSPSACIMPTGDLSDLHLLELTLTAHVVQILLSADFTQQDSMDTEEHPEGEALIRIYQHVHELAGLTISILPSPYQLYQYVRESVAPFLRYSALFFHFLTGVPAPAELQSVTEDEHSALCQYLSLSPNISSLFDNQGPVIQDLVKSWCSDDRIKTLLSASSDSIVKYPIPINQLIDLHKDYSNIINDGSTFPCPKSDGDDSRAPTLCLVCNKLLCSQSYCCQTYLDNGTPVGAATAHAHTCGAGVGIFLRVRECQLLLLSGRTKGCFFPPPYVDDYGETDQGLRRGNPLHLCLERYRRLQKLWLTHSIPEEIAHLLESNTSLTNIDWQHL